MAFRRVADLFSTMHILAALPGKTRASRSDNFPGGRLSCGGMVPEKISNAPFPKTISKIRDEKVIRRKGGKHGH
jgi:hypothetical protein